MESDPDIQQGYERRLHEALGQARSHGRFSMSRPTELGLPEQLRDIHKVTSVHLSDAEAVEELPDWLVELPNLKTISIQNSSIEVFPPVLLKLKIHHLAISSARLEELPIDLGRMSRLQSLILPGNLLESVPESILEMLDLVTLDLSYNHLSEAPWMQFPPNVRFLSLWGNGLKEIPRSIGEMVNLETLIISRRGRQEVSDDVHEMQPQPNIPLGRLIGSSGGHQGKITTIPKWLTDNCVALQWLDLSGNRIAEIPEEIASLQKLRGLVLTNNEILAVPETVGALPQLQCVALENNNISEIPDDLQRPTNLKYLGLSGNLLQLPPEILEDASSPETIWGYLAQARLATRPLDEAKLLIVGEGSVGKTSLVRRVIGQGFDAYEKKTEGIEVTKLSLPVSGSEVTLNVWDFGGQEIMHATHQFFLTRRSIYMVVLDARQGEDQNRIEYWLKLVNSFSGGSPVIVVGNKCEDFGLDIDRRGLKAKYPNIVAFLETSCATNMGIDELRRQLIETIASLDHVHDLLPASFFAVKEELEGLKSNYISFASYQELCAKHGVVSQPSQEVLVDFLHDLGTVLCFRADPRLRDTNILNPAWVTGGVYRILNSHVAAQLKGLLLWKDIDAILDVEEYPPDRRGFIIDMMRKFELCYESEGVFLVPDLLTKEEPDTGAWEDALPFAVKYGLLPSSLFGRLVVRMRRLISQDTVWRSGVVLRMDKNRALVRIDREDGLLTIFVSGPSRTRRGLLTAIRAELRSIEQTIPGLVSEERVPVPRASNVWVPYAHLLALEDAGKKTVVPQGLTVEFSIMELLDGIEASRDRRISETSMDSVADSAPDGIVDSRDVAEPWTPPQAMRLGLFLVLAVVLLAAAYVGASQVVGAGAAAAIGGGVLVLVVVIGLLILRASGRVSETGLVEVLKKAISRKGVDQGES
ncbi:COR domain-containing protein [Monashia sp. NPDC004114]